VGKVEISGSDEVIVTVGVDTHLDVHVAVVLDQFGRKLDTISVSTTGHGHRRLLEWAGAFGVIDTVGVEGTGSYGAGLTRYLRRQDIDVVEVVRPTRQTRRLSGKTDAVDAEAAARAVQAGTVLGQSKSQDCEVEMIRMLRVARRSAMQARTQAVNQLHAVVVAVPEQLRDRLRRLPIAKLVEIATGFRPGDPESLEAAAKLALTRASGKSRTVTRRRTKNNRLATIGYSWAFTAAARPAPTRDHYLRRRERGDGHPAALRHLFNRLLGQLHHCLATRQTYDPIKAFPRTATSIGERAADAAA
jgi:hypothetical protein